MRVTAEDRSVVCVEGREVVTRSAEALFVRSRRCPLCLVACLRLAAEDRPVVRVASRACLAGPAGWCAAGRELCAAVPEDLAMSVLAVRPLPVDTVTASTPAASAAPATPDSQTLVEV